MASARRSPPCSLTSSGTRAPESTEKLWPRGRLAAKRGPASMRRPRMVTGTVVTIRGGMVTRSATLALGAAELGAAQVAHF